MEAVGGELKTSSGLGEDTDSIDGDERSWGGHGDEVLEATSPRDAERNRELTGAWSCPVAVVK